MIQTNRRNFVILINYWRCWHRSHEAIRFQNTYDKAQVNIHARRRLRLDSITQKLRHTLHNRFKFQIQSAVRWFFSSFETCREVSLQVEFAFSLTNSFNLIHCSIWVNIVVSQRFFSAIKIRSIEINIRWKRHFYRQILQNKAINEQCVKSNVVNRNI